MNEHDVTDQPITRILEWTVDDVTDAMALEYRGAEPPSDFAKSYDKHCIAAAINASRILHDLDHWRVKATCYGNIVHGCSPALEAAGYPVDASGGDGAVGAIKRAVEAMAKDLESARVPDDDSYFYYYEGTLEDGLTAAQAEKEARDCLDELRYDAGDGWNEEADNIVWGRVLGRVTSSEPRPATPEDNVTTDEVVDKTLVNVPCDLARVLGEEEVAVPAVLLKPLIAIAREKAGEMEESTGRVVMNGWADKAEALLDRLAARQAQAAEASDQS